jgi:hypothetical protein
MTSVIYGQRDCGARVLYWIGGAHGEAKSWALNRVKGDKHSKENHGSRNSSSPMLVPTRLDPNTA